MENIMNQCQWRCGLVCKEWNVGLMEIDSSVKEVEMLG